jgi:hypothetical protein
VRPRFWPPWQSAARRLPMMMTAGRVESPMPERGSTCAKKWDDEWPNVAIAATGRAVANVAAMLVAKAIVIADLVKGAIGIGHEWGAIASLALIVLALEVLKDLAAASAK